MRDFRLNTIFFVRWFPCLFFILFVGTFLRVSEAPAETIDSIVAIVNEEIITLTELNDAVNGFLQGTLGVIRLDEEMRDRDQVRRTILKGMIDDKLIEHEIKRLGIVVSQRDIDDTIENMLKKNSVPKDEFIEKLRTKGIGLDKYKQNVKREMERIRFINHEIKAKITLSEEEIKRYYLENSGSFKEVKQVKVQHLLLSFPPKGDAVELQKVYKKAADLLSKIQKGDDFGELATKHSDGVSANSGGVMGWFKRGEITPFLEDVVFDLKKGEVSDIIKSSMGFHIIKLMDREEGDLQPLKEVEDRIRSILYSKKVESELKERLKDLREKSFVKVQL